MHAVGKKLQFSAEIAVCLRNNTRRRQVSAVAIFRPISARYARVEFDKQRSNSAACNRDVILMGQARRMLRATDPSVHKYCGHNVRRWGFTLRDQSRQNPSTLTATPVNTIARLSVCLSVCVAYFITRQINNKVSYRKQIARDRRSRSNNVGIRRRYEKFCQLMRPAVLGLGPRVPSINKVIGTDTERSGVCDFPLGSVENGPQNPTYYLTSPRWWWAGNRSTPASRHITTRLRKVD